MEENAGTLIHGNDAIAYRLRRAGGDKSAGGERLAVSLHGGGPTNMRTIDYLAPLFESLSIGLLRFDFPGQGESPGAMRESSLKKRYEHSRFVIDSLRGAPHPLHAHVLRDPETARIIEGELRNFLSSWRTGLSILGKPDTQARFPRLYSGNGK